MGKTSIQVAVPFKMPIYYLIQFNTHYGYRSCGPCFPFSIPLLVNHIEGFRRGDEREMKFLFTY